MVNLAVIGTNWITKQFIDATTDKKNIQLKAVYSRKLETAEIFISKLDLSDKIDTIPFDNLEKLSQSSEIDAVYIASPNSFHCEQALMFLKNGKHVICEKPLGSNIDEVTLLYKTAIEHNVILFEAYMTPHLPNYKEITQNLNQLGIIRKAHISFCQYSSRYQKYLNGEPQNTFDPKFSNGSIMDIGFYCVAFAVSIFNEPLNIKASATILPSGVDGCGCVILEYESFDVTIDHSKISSSDIPCEIQGENATIYIDKISLCENIKIKYLPHSSEGEKTLELTKIQHKNPMFYEVEAFISQIDAGKMDENFVKRSKLTSKVITKIRKLTGVTFPCDFKL